ncbi:MAG TPA: cytochrome c biogenesis protein CcsA [Bryobacteraceae bacterium]|nr:cytochrome c biogenesis protein CcsA [Bryobacteraceae bacterium]
MREKILYLLGVAAFVILARDIFVIARFPPEASQGNAFKIIFFHLPAWAAAFTAVGASLVTSILFLVTKNFQYDAIAVASTEVGVAFLTVGLVTGSLWARPIWGIWWTWDERLTTTLVLWLLYLGYLMLRRAIEEPTQRATFAAVVSIFAFIGVPIDYFSIRWWRTQHPAPVFFSSTGSFPHDWSVVMGWNILAMLMLATVIVAVRLEQEQSQRELDSLRRLAHAF